MRKHLTTSAVLLAVLAAVLGRPAPAMALNGVYGAVDDAAVDYLMSSEGYSAAKAYNLINSVRSGLSIAAVDAGAAADSTANLAYMMAKTETGWAAFQLPTVSAATPWVVAGLVAGGLGWLMGSAVALNTYGATGAAQPGDGSTWRFQTDGTTRYIWMTPSWVGVPGNQVAGCYSNAGTSTNWQGMLVEGQTPNMIGCAGDVLTWNTIAGQNYNTIYLSGPGATSALATTTDGGRTLGKYGLPSTAIKLYQAGRFITTQGSQIVFRLGESDLPALSPANNQAALQGLSDLQVAKMAASPAKGGLLTPVDPATVPTGANVIKPDTTAGAPVRGTWGGVAAEGTGVDNQFQPSPAPSPTPTPSPTPAPATVTKTGTTTSTSTTSSPDPTTGQTTTTTTTTTTETETPPSGESFVQHFISKLGTKFPFDWYADATVNATEQDLVWKSWQGTTYQGDAMERSWDLNGVKPILSAAVLVAMIGLGVAALLYL